VGGLELGGLHTSNEHWSDVWTSLVLTAIDCLPSPWGINTQKWELDRAAAPEVRFFFLLALQRMTRQRNKEREINLLAHTNIVMKMKTVLLCECFEEHRALGTCSKCQMDYTPAPLLFHIILI